MSAALGFDEIGRCTEEHLVGALALEPVALPRELARIEGTWRAEPAVLVARVYRGPRVRLARFVELHGTDLEIGNVLCLSVPELPLPIFGADLVGLGRDTAVVVADLSPVSRDHAVRAGQLAVLRELRAGAPALPRAGELPGWAARWFSSEALLTRVGPHERALVPGALAAFTAAFVRLATTTEPRRYGALDVGRQQAAYCEDHREHDRGLQLLRRIFEPSLADRFLREVLFPERLPQ